MNRTSARHVFVFLLLVAALVLGGCAPAATPAAAPTQPPAAVPASTSAPAPTSAPAAAPTAAPVAAATTAPATTAPAGTAAPAATAKPTTAPSATAWAVKPGTLRLATTTSTADTGLLDWLLPNFEKANNVKVDVVAVGTGQAIAIGQKGDADVLLVHARAQEDKFVADKDAKERFDVMYNDFILVGPKDDPAKAAVAKDAPTAFKAIADSKSIFVSRGDKSGTNTKELSVWASAKITPTKEMKWYNAIGQGMGDTLIFANEQSGYTLADRGTWLATKTKLPNLAIIFGGNSLAENKDKTLLNMYGVMAVNPDKHPGVQYDLAMKFVNWIIAPDTQKLIAGYGADKFGQPLFYPNSAPYKAANP